MLPRHRRCKGLASFKWISIRYYKYHAQVTGTKNSLKPCQTIKRKTSILTKNDFSINNWIWVNIYRLLLLTIKPRQGSYLVFLWWGSPNYIQIFELMDSNHISPVQYQHWTCRSLKRTWTSLFLLQKTGITNIAEMWTGYWKTIKGLKLTNQGKIFAGASKSFAIMQSIWMPCVLNRFVLPRVPCAASNTSSLVKDQMSVSILQIINPKLDSLSQS